MKGWIYGKKSPDGDYKYRELQGTYPVIFLTFAGVKETDNDIAVYRLCGILQEMVLDWFAKSDSYYNDFVKALLRGDREEVNEYMSEMADSMFSTFDAGNKPSDQRTPECFYHGFVLGLLVDLSGRYKVTSNRESGFGRYDVMLEPVASQNDDGIIMEFKVFNPKKEENPEETLQSTLCQIEEKKYEQSLLDSGIPKERIRKYGFAFQGKKVLIGRYQ